MQAIAIVTVERAILASKQGQAQVTGVTQKLRQPLFAVPDRRQRPVAEFSHLVAADDHALQRYAESPASARENDLRQLFPLHASVIVVAIIGVLIVDEANEGDDMPCLIGFRDMN